MSTNSDIIKKVKLALLAMQRHSWEQGVAMQAFLEQGDMEVVIAMAKEAAYRQLSDGRTAVLGDATSVTDPCSVGEALGVAAKLTGDKMLLSAYEKLLDWARNYAPANASGIVYHFTDQTQFWIDSMYMLPPFLACAGQYEEAIKQVDGYWNALFNPSKKMLSHMWDDVTKAYVREDIWGVGNGWALAGITRVISNLPPEYENTKLRFIQRIHTLIDMIITFMEPDGRFHDVIDNSRTFLEVNLSQMIAYTIYRGVFAGYMSDTYLTTADKLRKAANASIDCYGLIQDVCGAPDFDRPGVAAEGQAFYLLMEAAARDCYSKLGSY